jgi:hypothetical protein
LGYTVELWHCVTRITTINCFQKCVCILNQNKDNEDATELGIAKDDWSQLKVGVSFPGCISSDNDTVWCEV